MQEVSQNLRASVEAGLRSLQTVSEPDRAPAPGKWSPKQLVGHLIDSASVNLERFLRARDSDHLDIPGYPQDAWVEYGHYQAAPWEELLDLWRLLNLQVARVIEAMPEEAAQMERTRHACDRIAFATVPVDQPVTLAYLMTDYVDHLNYHLKSF